MIRILFFTFLFLQINLRLFAQTKTETAHQFPSYETVLSYLDKEIFSVSEQGSIVVSKQKEGYFLHIKPYGTELNELYSEQIWDVNTGIFSKIKPNAFLNQQEFYTGNLNLKSLLSNKTRFDLMLFYGYPNWSIDTKEVLEKKANKTARELEILARTYSEEAEAYIHPMQLRFNFPFTESFPAEKFGKISAERIQYFQERADKCIATWKELKVKDPNYSVSIIENIDVKMGHDLMNFYYILRSVQEDKLALKYLNQVSYPDWMLTLAKNYFVDCPTNAFFFSDGDSDTYPLLYLQAKENYRTDVQIWNLSLMQTSWYINMQAHHFKTNLTYTPAEINAMNYLYALLDGEISDLTSMEETLKLEAMKIERNESNEFTAIHLAPTLQISLFGKQIDMESKSYYSNLAEFILLDLFKNYPNNPFCFANEKTIKNLGLKAFLDMNGMAEIFSPQSTSDLEKLKRTRELLSQSYSIPFVKMESIGKNYAFRILSLISYFNTSTEESVYSELKKSFLSKFNPIDYLKSGDFYTFYYLSFGVEEPFSFSKQEAAFNTWRKNLKFDLENIDATLSDLEHYVYYMSQIRTEFSEKEIEFVKAIYAQLNAEISSKKWDSMKWTIEKMMGIQEDLLRL